MPDRSLPLYKRVWRLLRAAATEFGSDKAGRMGAALAFYSLFSLVPLLFLLVAVVGFVSSESVLATAPDCDTVTAAMAERDGGNPLDELVGQAEDVVGDTVADELAVLTCRASATRQGALWIGVGLAAFSGSAIFLQVQSVLNQVFGAPEERVTGITANIVQRLVALAAAVVLAILVLIPLVSVGVVQFVRDLIPDEAAWLRPVVGVGVPLTSFVLLVLTAGGTFRLLTRAEVSWRAALSGGAFTAILGLVGAFLVGTYLGLFGYAGALGALGSAAILLFFFNLMWMIFLFGAEVTKVYSDYLVHGDLVAPSERAQPPAPAPVQRPAPPPPSGGLAAFLAGLVVGWWSRRRQGQ